MASILGIILIVVALVLYQFSCDTYNCNSMEFKDIKRIMMIMILSGTGIILIDSWIVKPVLIAIGG